VALNSALAAASADYVVRMDADDYSRPDRFEMLYNYVTEHPEVDVVGTAMVSFDEDGEHGKIMPRKTNPKKMDFIHGSVTAHATTIMKKSSLMAVNGYRVAWETMRCEDTDLYMRMVANGAVIHNINDALYYVRQDNASIARRKYINRVKEAVVILIKSLTPKHGCKSRFAVPSFPGKNRKLTESKTAVQNFVQRDKSC
jgi:glycosyltransferase involved in cell wall biosynthesis